MKKESACRRGGTGGAARTCGEDGGDIGRHELLTASVEHGADDVANHVMQEAVAPNAIDVQSARIGAAFFPCGSVDGADGRGFSVGGAGGEVRIRCGERKEVVFAEKVFGALPESGQIQRPGAGVSIARKEGRTSMRPAGIDAVLIGLGCGGMAGMEGMRRRCSGKNADRRRQGAVECAEKAFRRDARVERKAGDLGESVHACIGTPRALGERSFTGDAAEGVLKFALDGDRIGLDLPSVEVGTVVGKSEFPGLRSRSRSVSGGKFGLGRVGHEYRFR